MSPRGHDWLIGADRRTAAAERIYSAAAVLMGRGGIDEVDIDALAAAVHCSRATVYRHAGSKAQIRDAVLANVDMAGLRRRRDAVSTGRPELGGV